MLTKEEVFQKASAYDFDAVEDYLEQGGNADIYDQNGSSLMTVLLEGYYRHVFYSDPDEVKFREDHNDDEEDHAHVNKYCRMPLEERPHQIKEQIDYLISKGVGVNAVDWEAAILDYPEDPDVDTPLMQAVVNCDYCMVKYLLEHGADPAQKVSSDGSYERYGFEVWLLEHMDIQILNGDTGDARMLDLEIAALLMHNGLDQWEGGWCIDVDKENRTIHGHSPRMKF